MTRHYCDICGELQDSNKIMALETIIFFDKKYEVCRECWEKMNEYYNDLMPRTKREFEIKFPRIIDVA